jgi:hypothetical protein
LGGKKAIPSTVGSSDTNVLKKKKKKVGIVAQTCNCSTWEAEVKESQVKGQPGLQEGDEAQW